MNHMINRRALLKGAAALGAVAVAGATNHVARRDHERSNILFLLADDLRFDGVGYLNKQVRTPNLDHLANDGVRFLNTFVTTSICCTSRASIFTGTYARRHGVWDFTTSLTAELLKNSYPAVLRRAGYRTGFFGKYGVGDYKKGNDQGDGIGPWPRVPAKDAANFDAVEDFDNYYEPSDVNREHHNNQRIAERAIAFMRSQPAQQPFCLSLSFKTPHANDVDDALMGQYVAEPDMYALYARDIFTEGPTVNDTWQPEFASGPVGGAPKLNDASFKTLPDFLRTSESRTRWLGRFSTPFLWQDSVRKYFALVTGMDRAIGQIMTVLEQKGLADNTVVFFTSDNGYFLGDYGLSDKWYGYEASIRVPLMIRPLQKPAVQEVAATALNIDLAPTMLALAGVPIPATMQGRDLSPLWGKRPLDKPWRTDFLYEHYLSGLSHLSDAAELEKLVPSSEGVRNERYTYLRYPRQKGENEQLFDRIVDATEQKNIIHTAPAQLVEQLRKRTDELIAKSA
jgi:arylsulfatase A-like enzyme